MFCGDEKDNDEKDDTDGDLYTMGLCLSVTKTLTTMWLFTGSCRALRGILGVPQGVLA